MTVKDLSNQNKFAQACMDVDQMIATVTTDLL
jgi:hypothetical protein